MNFETETADGPRCLSPHEAQIRLNQLLDALPHAAPSEVPAIHAEIEHFRIVLDPTRHFDLDLYAPDRSRPGWEPNP